MLDEQVELLVHLLLALDLRGVHLVRERLALDAHEQTLVLKAAQHGRVRGFKCPNRLLVGGQPATCHLELAIGWRTLENRSF